jgi:Holliday junction resolvase-like predicted endonuclease
MRTPREQGDRGELSAIVWLAGQGYPVFKPLFHSPHYDLVADLGSRLVRVEVKTCTVRWKGRWDVTVVRAAAIRAGAA